MICGMSRGRDALCAPAASVSLCSVCVNNYFEPSFDFAPVAELDCACSCGGMIVIAVA